MEVAGLHAAGVIVSFDEPYSHECPGSFAGLGVYQLPYGPHRQGEKQRFATASGTHNAASGPDSCTAPGSGDC